MRKVRTIITSFLFLLLAAVLVSLGGYFLDARNSAPRDTGEFEDFRYVVDDGTVMDEEPVLTYTDIDYTDDGIVPTSSEVITQICFGEDMLVIAEHPELNYTLMYDIDMSGIDWVPVPLTGSFDGQGHTIYNLNVKNVSEEGSDTRSSGMRVREDTRFAGLFSVLDHAEVKNLNLTGACISIEPEQSCYAGTIAGKADNAIISNCKVESHINMTGYGLNNGIGGILGYGSADISGCTVNAELIYSDMHSPDYSDGSVGGLIGDGLAIISGCTVNADIYATANQYLYCGGIAGQFSSKDFKLTDGTPGLFSSAASGKILYGYRTGNARKYCSEIFGYTSGVKLPKYSADPFTSDIETFTQLSSDLSPECDNPDCIEVVTKAGCSNLGYTVHTCKNCGYSYTDSYVMAHHDEYEWEDIEAPQPGIPGETECYCGICGKLMYTATVETSEPPPALSLSYVVLDMEYGGTAVIDASNAAVSELVWTSDNPEVASVDSSGRVSGLALGSTVISCTDGKTTIKCRVNVNYSSEQSFYRKFLFGWAWMD